MGDVRPLHPIRVVLGTRDRRFVQVTRFLLERNGLLVETARKPSEILSLVERERVGVVILDASDSLAAAARTMAAIEALHPETRVILVTADTHARSREDPQPLPKWSPIEDLISAIEAAYLRSPASAQPSREAVRGEKS